MKLILVGLLVLSWTHSFQCYSQTDSVYCLPIDKARRLIASAIRLPLSDSIVTNLSHQVTLLQSQNLAQYRSFSNLLEIEREKYQIQKETTAHMESLANSWRDQSVYYQKAAKKQRRKKNLLIYAGVGLIILVIVK